MASSGSKGRTEKWYRDCFPVEGKGSCARPKLTQALELAATRKSTKHWEGKEGKGAERKNLGVRGRCPCHHQMVHYVLSSPISVGEKKGAKGHQLFERGIQHRKTNPPALARGKRKIYGESIQTEERGRWKEELKGQRY